MKLKEEVKKTAIIAKYTFLEIYDSRVMINIILLGLALLLICFVATEFTYSVPARVAMDFGLGTLSIVAIVLAIFFGANLIYKEIDLRTVHMMLSRPVSRYSFLLGKLLGMSTIIFINIFILGCLTIGFFLFLGGEMTMLVLWALFFSFLESIMVLLIVVFFSLFSNIVISVICTISIYIAGHALNEVLTFNYVTSKPMLFGIVNLYTSIFPNFAKLNLKDFLLYEQAMPLDYLLVATLYGMLYIILLFILSSLIFSRKNLD